MELKQSYKGNLSTPRIHVLVQPTSEPVTLADFTDDGDNYGKIDFATDDNLITAMIKTARIWVENYCQIKLMPQVLTAAWKSYTSEVWLPFPPHIRVNSVKLRYQGETDTLVSGEDYYQAGVYDDYLLQFNSVEHNKELIVEYESGYDGGASQVPQDIKIAIMKIVSNLYDHRGDFSDKSMAKIPFDSKILLNPYKRF